MPKFNSGKTIFKQALEVSKRIAAANLLDQGVDANFLLPILDRLNLGVINRDQASDLIDELTLLIAGSKTQLGLLDRYTSQVSRDSLMQFSATYDSIVSQDLGFEFYRYVGTRIRDTRPFCMRFLNKFFHADEVCDLGKGIDPITGKSLSSELKQGRISGTNCSNIFTNRGGWNCRHRFTAINTQFVPKNVLKRNLDNSNWKPTKAQLSRLG